MAVASVTLAGVQIEGNLIAPDLTSELLAGNFKGQAIEDFGFSKADKLADEIAVAWGDAKAYWAAFQRAFGRLPEDDSATSVTREQWAVPLLRSLGYEPIYTAKAEVVDGQTYAISHRTNPGEDKPPIHILGCRVGLEKRPPSGTPRLSAHALMQEYLNRTEHLWGVVTNGLQWRLLRDSSLMTRLTYIEFDLEQILNGENFAEFGLFYRLFHRSRLPQGMEDADECLLEFYHQETLQQGGRVRDRLRDGVEKALIQLGTGFLQHPENEALRQRLMPSPPTPLPEGEGSFRSSFSQREKGLGDEGTLSHTKGLGDEGTLSHTDYYRQLLKLIYRLLFLMVAESRDLLLDGQDAEKGRIYREYYSIDRLRAMAERPTWRREGFQDLWQGLRVTFRLFDENWRGKLLGLSPLNGDLFGSKSLLDLDDCAIDNHDLLLSVRYLSLYEQKGQLRRVNYGALDVEELGSVYESLLDFHPQVAQRQGIYEFQLVVGSDRKTTGSYYTPPELVGQLIKSALEPVIEAKLQSALTPQPPLPAGEEEQEKWEVPAAIQKKMQEVARQFRKEPTASEAILWQALRSRKLENRKFRRQHPIGTFIVDFFCHEERLIVEVDGGVHNRQKELDRQRQELLESLGLRFLRVTSEEVETNLPNVLEKIHQAFFPSSPSPFSPREKGDRKFSSSPNSFSSREKGDRKLSSSPNSFSLEEKEDRKLPSPSGRGVGGEGKSLQQLQEQALLSLKICDPACGSGHFLLAAARRVGKELARVRTGEAQPGAQALRQAIRDVIQHCIYGVDLNPLAVDLCKVALWIEGLCHGMSLNFLDHRIKCGNSLVGVLDLDCLRSGIPDQAYKAVTGDDKKLSSAVKKTNKQEKKDIEQGQLSLIFDVLEQDREQYAQSSREIGKIRDNDPPTVREKEEKYRRSRHLVSWLRDYSACNLWTAAFFMPITEQNLALLPTSAALENLLQGNWTTQKIVDAANQLAEEKRFFHWALEFPDVFEQGGFDCVLGNPPWERIKLQEKEFFASRSAEIANAANKAEREKLIKALSQKNPELSAAFDEAKHDAEAQSKFVRESHRFPLTAIGDVNTYAVFSETVREIISPQGRAGIIVPTGIATDDTCKRFFGDLSQQKKLASLYDFENREAIFSAVHRSYKFSLLCMSGKPIAHTNFAFFLTQPKQTEARSRRFQLSPQDIALLNPNTLTCSVFRTSVDAELTKKIYKNTPVLENEQTGKNPWGISFMRMFDVTNDFNIFCTEAQLIEFGFKVKQGKYTKGTQIYVPMYEGRMVHHYDHMYATYDSKQESYVDNNRYFNNMVQTQYWVPVAEVDKRLKHRNWKHEWLYGFRRVTRNTDERTIIGSFLPNTAVTYGLYLVFSEEKTLRFSLLAANFNSVVLDYLCRNKITQPSLTYGVLNQLPVIPPDRYSQTDIEFISSRVLELVYTTYDLQPFAQDMGYDGEPFLWNPDRRALLRAELDAYYAKLYGLTKDELRYILDPADIYGSDFPSETFRVLKNNEIKQFGEYRTQRLVLEAWDRMFG
ncbi:restriction endonuclease [filamentous cyanobacterium CCP2]|nr:restriction endonuclease [filamentous cyanobacterium CCP2]